VSKGLSRYPRSTRENPSPADRFVACSV
jgi:hypothetical protein